jgi:hypothetical protein
MRGQVEERQSSVRATEAGQGRAEMLPLCVSLSSLSKCFERPKSIST